MSGPLMCLFKLVQYLKTLSCKLAAFKTQEMLPVKSRCPVSLTNEEPWPHWAGSKDLWRACQTEGTANAKGLG